jgi:NAD(P)-dependent dehydrogenase (short-subunit alcohol dehydrogenase family)
VRLDVSREEDWAGAVETILAKHGRIDILVNNAGIIAYEPLDALDLAGWQRVIAVNQTGVFLGMRAAWERSHLIDKCGGLTNAEADYDRLRLREDQRRGPSYRSRFARRAVPRIRLGQAH